MVKIRVATLVWRDGYGGAERSVRDLAAALDRDQFDMRFFYLSGPLRQFGEEIKNMGYEVVNLYWRNGFSLRGRWRLIQRLRHFNPAVVHDHLIPPFVRPLIKRMCHVPILNTEHGTAMRRMVMPKNIRHLIEGFDLRFCDCVLANSYASREALKQAYNFPESRIRVLYLGIDLQRFDPPNDVCTARNHYRIGFVGRILNDRKGADYLPRIARILLDRGYENIEFVVVGDGPDRSTVEALSESLRVSHVFSFLGFRSDIPALLHTFDILLMPSRFESFGLSPLEALAMGVSVVAFGVGGLREAVGECEAARLVPPGDVEAMAQAIIDILGSPHIRSQSARTYVETHFSNQRMAKDLQEVYKEYASR